MSAVSIDFNIQDLTHVMAGLNGLSVLCLMAGYLFIRNGERNKHRASMIAALSV